MKLLQVCNSRAYKGPRPPIKEPTRRRPNDASRGSKLRWLCTTRFEADANLAVACLSRVICGCGGVSAAWKDEPVQGIAHPSAKELLSRYSEWCWREMTSSFLRVMRETEREIMNTVTVLVQYFYSDININQVWANQHTMWIGYQSHVAIVSLKSLIEHQFCKNDSV